MSNAKQDTLHIHHKGEANFQIIEDQADDMSLHNTLSVCIDIFSDVSQSDGALMNIATREMAHPDVNADDAINIG